MHKKPLAHRKTGGWGKAPQKGEASALNISHFSTNLGFQLWSVRVDTLYALRSPVLAKNPPAKGTEKMEGTELELPHSVFRYLIRKNTPMSLRYYCLP